MKVLKKIVMVAMLALLPLPAYCGTLTGTIQPILFNKDIPNMVFVQINASSVNAPACASERSRMVIDITTPLGKALLGNLIALKLSSPNTVVSLAGTNSCTLWGDTESFSYTFL